MKRTLEGPLQALLLHPHLFYSLHVDVRIEEKKRGGAVGYQQVQEIQGKSIEEEKLPMQLRHHLQSCKL